MKLRVNRNSMVSVALVLVVGAGLFYLGDKFGSNVLGALHLNNDSKDWMAVTLDNGSIYFGHITSRSDKQVVLENAYFAQTNPKAQTTDASGKTTGDASQPQYLLTKVGQGEVYGPEETLDINSSHVLYIQILSTDSQVVKTINAQQ